MQHSEQLDGTRCSSSGFSHSLSVFVAAQRCSFACCAITGFDYWYFESCGIIAISLRPHRHALITHVHSYYFATRQLIAIRPSQLGARTRMPSSSPSCSKSLPRVSSRAAQQLTCFSSSCCTTLCASASRASFAPSAFAARLGARRASESSRAQTSARAQSRARAAAPVGGAPGKLHSCLAPTQRGDLPACIHLDARTPCSGWHSPSAPAACL